MFTPHLTTKRPSPFYRSTWKRYESSKMDKVGQVASAFNGRVLKEPRGFIKCIEWIVAIFAFATTTSFSSSTDFTIKCSGTDNRFSIAYSYPFDLQDVGILVPICNSTVTQSLLGLEDSEASSAQFYVFVGVMAFLYCLGALILYVFFDDLYRKNPRVVIVDFGISIAFAALWLISSSAWAQGVSNVKFYTDLQESGYYQELKCEANQCNTISGGNFAGLNISIIFGFLNFVVWAGNLWFLYKETPWFKIQGDQPTTPGTPRTPATPVTPTDMDPQRV